MPHCTADYPWYITKFALGFASILFLYMGFLKEKYSLCVCGPRRRRLEKIDKNRDDRCVCLKGFGAPVRYECGCSRKIALNSGPKNLTRMALEKMDHQSLVELGAAAREKDHHETDQPAPQNIIRKTCANPQHQRYESNGKLPKITCSKRRRFPGAEVGVQLPAERFYKCKRDRYCRRHSKRAVINCVRNRCRNREDARILNIIGEADCQSGHEDENDDVSSNMGNASCPKCKTFNTQQVQTISEEHLIRVPDKTESRNVQSEVEEICSHERRCKTLTHERRCPSKSLSEATRDGKLEPVDRFAVRYKRRKCCHCSRYSGCGHCGSQSVTKNNSESSNPTKLSNSRSLKQSCTHGFRYPENCNISLDAFRISGRTSEKQDSILWKVAAGIYEISMIIKDGLVKCLNQDANGDITCGKTFEYPQTFTTGAHNFDSEDNKSESIRVKWHRDATNDVRSVGTSIECNAGANYTARTTDDNTVFANREIGAVGYTMLCDSRSAGCTDISGGSNHDNDGINSFQCSVEGRGFPNKAGTEYKSVSCTATIRKNDFTTRRASSESSISSLSSSTSIGNSNSAIEDQPIGKKAKNNCGQGSGDIRIASTGKPTDALNDRNSTFSFKAKNGSKYASKNENFQAYDEIDRRNLVCYPFKEVDGMFLSEIRDEKEKTRNICYSSVSVEDLHKNRKFRRVPEEVVQESYHQNGRNFREKVYHSLETSSETNSTNSSNNISYKRPKRILKISSSLKVKRDTVHNRSNRKTLDTRNDDSKNTRIDYRSQQPQETLVQSHIEYFKEVESEEETQELMLGSPGSKIPRLVCHRGYIERDVTDFKSLETVDRGRRPLFTKPRS